MRGLGLSGGGEAFFWAGGSPRQSSTAASTAFLPAGFLLQSYRIVSSKAAPPRWLRRSARNDALIKDQPAGTGRTLLSRVSSCPARSEPAQRVQPRGSQGTP